MSYLLGLTAQLIAADYKRSLKCKYKVVIIKDDQSSVLEHKGKTSWSKTKARKHCKDIIEMRTCIKDFDHVHIEEV